MHRDVTEPRQHDVIPSQHIILTYIHNNIALPIDVNIKNNSRVPMATKRHVVGQPTSLPRACATVRPRVPRQCPRLAPRHHFVKLVKECITVLIVFGSCRRSFCVGGGGLLEGAGRGVCSVPYHHGTNLATVHPRLARTALER